jgi:hypothetical protein
MALAETRPGTRGHLAQYRTSWGDIEINDPAEPKGSGTDVNLFASHYNYTILALFAFRRL